MESVRAVYLKTVKGKEEDAEEEKEDTEERGDKIKVQETKVRKKEGDNRRMVEWEALMKKRSRK